jgi:DNA-directed RNA polymerase omega subunit
MIHFPQDLGSKYRFITLAAQRCDQLIRGAKPRVETRSHKPTTIAQEEVLAGLVELRVEAEPAPPALLAEPLPEPPAPAAAIGLEG